MSRQSELHQFVYEYVPMEEWGNAKNLIDSEINQEVNSVLSRLEENRITLSTGATIIPLSAVEEERSKYNG